MLDSAVTFFGTVIENALAEREELGSGNHKQWVARYTTKQLFNPAFRLPRQGQAEATDISVMRGVDGAFFDKVE